MNHSPEMLRGENCQITQMTESKGGYLSADTGIGTVKRRLAKAIACWLKTAIPNAELVRSIRDPHGNIGTRNNES